MTVHRTDLRNHQLSPEPDEFSFRDAVRICIPRDADEVLLTAAKDFADYLFTTMNVEAFLSKAHTHAVEETARLIGEMIEILRAEQENARQTIPLVNFDSILGFEPSMEYVTDEARILWKINQVDEEIQMLRTLL